MVNHKGLILERHNQLIDPTKVTRTALQHAASIASMIITTEAMITDAPQDDAAGGGMPDMGGMGGMGGMM